MTTHNTEQSILEATGTDIRVLNVADLEPNTWNPNSMELEYFESLAGAIRDEGSMSQPVMVRPKPDVVGKFIIVDGEHRWKAAKIAGLDKIVCVVVNYDETKSKVRTLSMNRIRGQDIPIKLASLIVDLQKTYTDKQIAAMTGVRVDEQASVLALLQVPDMDFSEGIPQIGSDTSNRPIEINLFLLPDEHEDYEMAMSRVMALAGGHVTALLGEEVTDYDKAMRDTQSMCGIKARNIALATICRVFNALPDSYKKQISVEVAAAAKKKKLN